MDQHLPNLVGGVGVLPLVWVVALEQDSVVARATAGLLRQKACNGGLTVCRGKQVFGVLNHARRNADDISVG